MYQVISKATERSFKRELERKLRIIVETSEKDEGNNYDFAKTQRLPA